MEGGKGGKGGKSAMENICDDAVILQHSNKLFKMTANAVTEP